MKKPMEKREEERGASVKSCEEATVSGRGQRREVHNDYVLKKHTHTRGGREGHTQDGTKGRIEGR